MTRPHAAPPNRRARRAWRRSEVARAIQATIDSQRRALARETKELGKRIEERLVKLRDEWSESHPDDL